MAEQTDFNSFLSITENRSKIMAVIVAMVRDFDLAEDLFQQTVLEILRAADRFDPERDFLPWACGVARNVVRRHWQAAQRRPAPATQELLDSLAELAMEEQDEDIWQAERAALNRCLDKLPERMRRLFLLRYGHNQKADLLARLAAFTPGSLRTTLARLRLKLRQCINAEVEQSI
jgi:RNA polymerase sigma-70 factor, ECF subfamily